MNSHLDSVLYTCDVCKREITFRNWVDHQVWCVEHEAIMRDLRAAKRERKKKRKK